MKLAVRKSTKTDYNNQMVRFGLRFKQLFKILCRPNTPCKREIQNIHIVEQCGISTSHTKHIYTTHSRTYIREIAYTQKNIKKSTQSIQCLYTKVAATVAAKHTVRYFYNNSHIGRHKHTQTRYQYFKYILAFFCCNNAREVGTIAIFRCVFVETERERQKRTMND